MPTFVLLCVVLLIEVESFFSFVPTVTGTLLAACGTFSFVNGGVGTFVEMLGVPAKRDSESRRKLEVSGLLRLSFVSTA